MALGELQKKAAQAIVNVFETGTPLGRYGSVTVILGDAAVRLWQSHRNLEVDGVLGHATRAALEL